MSLNKVMLIGRLGADPETRRLNGGDVVVSMRIATSERWKDKATGERKERTEWHSVVIYNEALANLAADHLKKGSEVYVEGQLQTRQWEKNGEKRYTTEIVLQKFKGEIRFVGSRQDDDGGDRTVSRGSKQSGPPQSKSFGGLDDLDDDIPF